MKGLGTDVDMPKAITYFQQSAAHGNVYAKRIIALEYISGEFLEQDVDKGIFVLAKTSNPSSGELQDRLIDGKPVYEIMGEMCENWGSRQIGAYGYSAVGAVVGAPYPEQLAELRKKLPHTLFLVPGCGAQGGGADDVKNAFDENGLGAIINSSRGIMCAWKKQGLTENDFAKAAYSEAVRMRDEIIGCLGKIKI